MFGHRQAFKKIYILKVKYYMNRILISENALIKWYLLGSIEFLATLKCLIIICCFLPAEFWQKYAEVSELTGHVRTSGNYGSYTVHNDNGLRKNMAILLHIGDTEHRFNESIK